MTGQTFNNSSVDRVVQYLIFGMVVIGFVVVLILGLARSQDHAKSASEASSFDHQTNSHPQLDFGN